MVSFIQSWSKLFKANMEIYQGKFKVVLERKVDPRHHRQHSSQPIV